MKLIEYILLCTTILGWILVLWSGSQLRPLRARIIVAILLVTLLLHIFIENWRLAMIPVYLFSISLMIYSLFKKSKLTSCPPKRIKTILLSFLSLLAGMLCWGIASALPLFQFTKPSGPYSVGVMDYTLTDPDRKFANGAHRQLNVRIWYPASDEGTISATYIPQADLWAKVIRQEYGVFWSLLLNSYRHLELPAQYAAPFYKKSGSLDKLPVVFYLHGNQLGAGFTSTFQALELASQGYIVIALEHPGTAFLSVFDEKSYITFTQAFKGLPDNFNAHNTASLSIIREMQADVQFVLDYLQHIEDNEPNSPFSRVMDFNRIALIGHSFGGAAAAHILTNTSFAKVAINLDGYLYGEYPDKALEETQLKPLLILNGGLEIKGLEETMTGLEKERIIRHRLLGKEGLEVTLPEAGHLSFTDIPLYSPLLKPLAPDIREQHRLINEHTLKFLEQHL
ncbi:putative dienelactone hydrolase [Paenibacillus turicensis]|uniref:Dienelactone hydrolase n=1 Tax=Paenibacillus turicensis TaxID=160487 RepID=A0ABS4FT35_9BACL|nr:hypothetical protein [Paenibacillus turicensis]MBP1905716.1 putative dienelactone hydrolase [Paenibacillus turicensis]